MIYLASPYSHPRDDVREARYQLACYATAKLMHAGESVFSPVVHSHPLVRYGFPTDWSFWQRHDREHLARCEELVVLTIRGWRESVGVAAEVALAGELGKPVRYAFFSSLVPTSPTLAHVASGAES
ncbi:MAG: DUF1937 family protein [Planctomycetaceae bacterium]